jgi:hypothetical protein
MLSRTITYTNFLDTEVSEVFLFNMTEAELVEMSVSHNGGYEVHLQRIIDAKNPASVVAEIKSLILKSYGIKREEDGVQYFHKDEELSIRFSRSEAYSSLFMELSVDADKASKFFLAILPKSLSAQIPQDKPVGPPPSPNTPPVSGLASPVS